MLENKSLTQLKALMADVKDLDDDRLVALRKDPRQGAKKLVQQVEKRIQRQAAAYKAYQARLTYERQLLDQDPGLLIAGVDEVGRGPIAGPVVAAAVILPADTHRWIAVTDSKQISDKTRRQMADLIRQEAVAYAICEISPQIIDQVNIYQASRLAMKGAVDQLSVQPGYLLIDAMTVDLDIPQMAITKGDSKSLSIAAASILAKVYRDDYMIQMAQEYPEYHFDQHMGYPTSVHLQALAKYGQTSIHRQSFGPVQRTQKNYKPS